MWSLGETVWTGGGEFGDKLRSLAKALPVLYLANEMWRHNSRDLIIPLIVFSIILGLLTLILCKCKYKILQELLFILGFIFMPKIFSLIKDIINIGLLYIPIGCREQHFLMGPNATEKFITESIKYFDQRPTSLGAELTEFTPSKLETALEQVSFFGYSSLRLIVSVRRFLFRVLVICIQTVWWVMTNPFQVASALNPFKGSHIEPKQLEYKSGNNSALAIATGSMSNMLAMLSNPADLEMWIRNTSLELKWEIPALFEGNCCNFLSTAVSSLTETALYAACKPLLLLIQVGHTIYAEHPALTTLMTVWILVMNPHLFVTFIPKYLPFLCVAFFHWCSQAIDSKIFPEKTSEALNHIPSPLSGPLKGFLQREAVGSLVLDCLFTVSATLTVWTVHRGRIGWKDFSFLMLLLVSFHVRRLLLMSEILDNYILLDVVNLLPSIATCCLLLQLTKKFVGRSVIYQELKMTLTTIKRILREFGLERESFMLTYYNLMDDLTWRHMLVTQIQAVDSAIKTLLHPHAPFILMNFLALRILVFWSQSKGDSSFPPDGLWSFFIFPCDTLLTLWALGASIASFGCSIATLFLTLFQMESGVPNALRWALHILVMLMVYDTPSVAQGITVWHVLLTVIACYLHLQLTFGFVEGLHSAHAKWHLLHQVLPGALGLLSLSLVMTAQLWFQSQLWNVLHFLWIDHFLQAFLCCMVSFFLIQQSYTACALLVFQEVKAWSRVLLLWAAVLLPACSNYNSWSESTPWVFLVCWTYAMFATEASLLEFPCLLDAASAAISMIKSDSLLLEDIDICKICNVPLARQPQLKMPECGHSMHLECFTCWLRCYNECPSCKTFLVRSRTNGSSLFAKGLEKLSCLSLWAARGLDGMSRMDQGELDLSNWAGVMCLDIRENWTPLIGPYILLYSNREKREAALRLVWTQGLGLNFRQAKNNETRPPYLQRKLLVAKWNMSLLKLLLEFFGGSSMDYVFDSAHVPHPRFSLWLPSIMTSPLPKIKGRVILWGIIFAFVMAFSIYLPDPLYFLQGEKGNALNDVDDLQYY